MFIVADLVSLSCFSHGRPCFSREVHGVSLHQKGLQPNLHVIYREYEGHVLTDVISVLSKGSPFQIILSKPLVKSAYPKLFFLNTQLKHMLWVLKITVSMRRLSWASKTYVKTDG